MAEGGYLYKRRLGLTGKNTDSCGVAGIERITSRRITASTYLSYLAAVHSRPDSMTVYKKRMVEVYEHISDDLGLDDWKDIEFLRARKYQDFAVIIGELMASKFDVVIDIYNPKWPKSKYEATHSVGLMPAYDGKFTIHSTWIPHDLRGAQELEDIHHDVVKLDRVTPSKAYPFVNANITGYPPH